MNGRPAAPDPLIRSGGQVRVVYRVANVGNRDIADVRLAVSGAVGGSVVCPSGGADVPELEERSSVVCVAVVDAAPGPHDGTVTATGDAEHDDNGQHKDRGRDQSVAASASYGYRGVGGLITATDSVSVTPTATGGRVILTYSVTDVGNLPVYDLAPADPLVPAGRITCTGTTSGLAPGAVARCSATVDLAPGSYRSALSMAADDRTSTAGSAGGTVPPPTLSASASSGFTVVALPPPPPPQPPTPTPTPTPVSAPPPPPPTPQPTYTSSPTPTPTPTPTVVHPTPPRPTPTPKPPPPPPPTTPRSVPPPPHLVRPQRPRIKTSLFVLVMMMPAAGAAAVLAARRK